MTVTLAVDDASVDLLDDQFRIDFRPENYFGITGVNLIPGEKAGRFGQAGYMRRTAEDYTMSTMIESGSLVIDGTLTSEVIAGLDEVMRYADGLAPLIRSGMILADRVAKTQQALPSVHLRRINGILAVLPAFEDGLATALFDIFNSAYNRRRTAGSVSMCRWPIRPTRRSRCWALICSARPARCWRPTRPT